MKKVKRVVSVLFALALLLPAVTVGGAALAPPNPFVFPLIAEQPKKQVYATAGKPFTVEVKAVIGVDVGPEGMELREPAEGELVYEWYACNASGDIIGKTPIALGAKAAIPTSEDLPESAPLYPRYDTLYFCALIKLPFNGNQVKSDPVEVTVVPSFLQACRDGWGWFILPWKVFTGLLQGDMQEIEPFALFTGPISLLAHPLWALYHLFK